MNLYADDMEPIAERTALVYRLALSNEKRMEHRTDRPPVVYVEVEDDGLLIIQDHSWFNQKTFRIMEWEERREVYDWLIEWEYAEWRKIGPEDSELFATTKLHEPV
jgi:hypothetical protein